MLMLKGKRGAQHMEIIISFILFIVILGFLIYYMVPIRQKNVPDVLTTIVKQGLDEHATTQLNEIKMIANSKKAKIKIGCSPEEKYDLMYWDEATDNWKLEDSGGGISVLGKCNILYCGDKFKSCSFKENILNCEGIICHISSNSISCTGLKEWCNYKCTKIEKHSLIDFEEGFEKRLTVKGEENENLKWNFDGTYIYIEKPNYDKDIKFYDIYYYSDMLGLEEDYSPGMLDCLTPDDTAYSIPKKLKVYSKFKFEETKKLSSEQLKQLFDFPVGSDFSVTLLISNETFSLETSEIPERVIVRAKEFPITILEKKESEKGMIIDKKIAYINIKTW